MASDKQKAFFAAAAGYLNDFRKDNLAPELLREIIGWFVIAEYASDKNVRAGANQTLLNQLKLYAQTDSDGTYVRAFTHLYGIALDLGGKLVDSYRQQFPGSSNQPNFQLTSSNIPNLSPVNPVLMQELRMINVFPQHVKFGELMNAGIKIMDVTGDGNCLYHSLAYILYGSIQDLSTVLALKAEIIQYLKVHVDRFIHVPEWRDDHIAHVSTPNAWGTDVEIVIFAELYDIPVTAMVTRGTDYDAVNHKFIPGPFYGDATELETRLPDYGYLDILKPSAAEGGTFRAHLYNPGGHYQVLYRPGEMTYPQYYAAAGLKAPKLLIALTNLCNLDVIQTHIAVTKTSLTMKDLQYLRRAILSNRYIPFETIAQDFVTKKRQKEI